MATTIISYNQMCAQENASLQRGMNFRLHGRHSVILMSQRPNAPYADQVDESGTVLIYEGHDHPKAKDVPYPKMIDQPEMRSSGSLFENGKFARAALAAKRGDKAPDLVRVYEKLYPGIWSDNGYFQLVDSWNESDGTRTVFKFKLVAIETEEDDLGAEQVETVDVSPGRIIPSAVKREVWIRDGGKCVTCGKSDNLHFDHIVPFAKGGSSSVAANIQLLCARHNLEKSDKII